MSREHRRDDRYNVAVAASIENVVGLRRAVRVTNLSASGCRFVSQDSIFGRGALIVLSFGRIDSVAAKIKWRFSGNHGVHFDQALDPAQLDHIRLFLSEEPALVAEREPVSG